MAYVFELEYGSTSVNLANAAGISHKGYFPQVGDDFSETGTVTESFDVRIRGADVATMQGFIRSLNLAFMMARQRQERNAGDRVYVNHQPTNYTTEWRSEILDGKVNVTEHPQEVMNKNFFTATVSWVRRNWWEGPQADVPLTNGNGTDDTAGLRIYFCNDGGTVHTTYKRNNYATIDGANDIGGDLPGYGILKVTTLPETTTKLYTQYGRHGDIGSTNKSWWHEIGVTADANSSNGDYAAAGDTGVANQLSTFLSSSTGAPVPSIRRYFGRMGFSASTGVTRRIVPAVSTAFGTLEFLPAIYITVPDTGMHIYPLGVAPLGQYTTLSASPIIYLGATAYGGTGGYFNVDFYTSAPADIVRDYTLTGTAANDYTIDDDTVLDTLKNYALDSGGETQRFAISATGSNKILLYPGFEQAIYILAEPWTRDGYCTITLKYRPRRSTL